MPNRHKVKIKEDIPSKKSGFKRFFVKSLNALSNALYPPNIKCICCGKDLPTKQEIEICESCIKEINFIDEKRACKRCGAKLVGEGEFCLDCMDKPRSFDVARAVCVYDNLAQMLIHSFKFGDKVYLARTMARLMALKYINLGWDCDVVVAVPLSKKRMRTRGYNQSALLADIIGEIINKPVDNNILSKVKDTHDQVGLNFQDRQDNLNGSIVVKDKSKVAGKSVLLIDDVMTTGATANVCAEVLHSAKAGQVCVLTFAHVMVNLRTVKNDETKINNKK